MPLTHPILQVQATGTSQQSSSARSEEYKALVAQAKRDKCMDDVFPFLGESIQPDKGIAERPGPNGGTGTIEFYTAGYTKPDPAGHNVQSHLKLIMDEAVRRLSIAGTVAASERIGTVLYPFEGTEFGRVILRPQPENKYDKHAMLVMHMPHLANETCVGWVPALISEKVDRYRGSVIAEGVIKKVRLMRDKVTIKVEFTYNNERLYNLQGKTVKVEPFDRFSAIVK